MADKPAFQAASGTRVSPIPGEGECSLRELNGAILEAVEDGIFGLSTAGMTTFINGAAMQMTGYSAADVTGKYHHDLVHHTRPDGTVFPREECSIYRVCSTGVAYRCEEDLFWRKDGTSFPVSYLATPLKRNGETYGVVVVFRDITARQECEAAAQARRHELERLVQTRTAELQQANAQLSSVLASASLVAIVSINLDGLITLFNKGAEKMLGYTKEEVILKATPRIFHIDSEVEARGRELSQELGRPVNGLEVFTYPAQQGTPDVREWTLVHKNGSAIPVWLGVTAVVNDSGTIVGYLGVAYDTSERKKTEESLKAAMLAAESANRAKSEFLATMSHEIRTPMNGIIGMASLLLNSKLDPIQRKRATTLRESGESLLCVLNDILDFSRLEANKLELEVADCNLRRVVEGVADIMALKAQEKALEFTLYVEPRVTTQRFADSSRLRQILLNLVGNAIKFTAEGEVGLFVRQDPAGGAESVYFEITDTGIGIPLEKQHLLFERFSQADASTSRKYGGSGLGLSIVKGLVNMMGGSIGFRSNPGIGSTFWFTVALPLQPGVQRPAGLALPGKRVLVVDDSRASRRILGDLLAIWSCDDESVDSAAAALVRLRDRSLKAFDALIIDFEMPGISGGELGATIRSEAQLAHLPIVLLTPLNQSCPPGAWELEGFTGRVSKPVKQGELGTCLANALGFHPVTGLPAKNATTPVRQPAKLAQGRILLVEDNPVNQEVALGLLEHLGYEADVFADGHSALRALQANDYKLLLVDCQMPGMDGYELSRLIRNPSTDVINHAVPIIAVTAHSLSGDREKCLQAGMDDYLTKPLRPEVLDQMLNRYLDAMPTDARTDTAPEVPPPVSGPPASYHFDERDLLERMMGNHALAKRIANAFLETMPEQLAALTDAVNRFDAKATVMAAHSIKGAAANIGSASVRDLAARLEQSGEEGALAYAPQSLPALAEALQSLEPAIHRFCERKR